MKKRAKKLIDISNAHITLMANKEKKILWQKKKEKFLWFFRRTKEKEEKWQKKNQIQGNPFFSWKLEKTHWKKYLDQSSLYKNWINHRIDCFFCSSRKFAFYNADKSIEKNPSPCMFVYTQQTPPICKIFHR